MGAWFLTVIDQGPPSVPRQRPGRWLGLWDHQPAFWCGL